MRVQSLAVGQRGAALVVGLIMLLLLTLIVSSAFTMSTVNLKAVGNMQMRDEAIAAANAAIEQVLSTNFVGSSNQVIPVEINNDSSGTYQVQIEPPFCIRATIAQAVSPSSVNLGALSSNTWNTVWQINASVGDSASGTAVKVRTGVRVLLSDAQKNSHCP